MKRSRRPVIYLAHPVRGDVPGNLARAKRWLRWVYDHFQVTVVSQWIVDCEVLDEGNDEHRTLGLINDQELVVRCDGIWLVGGRLSAGMKIELAAALEEGIEVLDLTSYGEMPSADALDAAHVHYSTHLRG